MDCEIVKVLTPVKVEVVPPGKVSEQKVEETKVALREFGLTDQVNTE